MDFVVFSYFQTLFVVFPVSRHLFFISRHKSVFEGQPGPSDDDDDNDKDDGDDDDDEASFFNLQSVLPSTDCQFVDEINDQPSQREILTNNDDHEDDMTRFL